MRAFILALFLAAPVAAQPILFPDTPTEGAWRVAAGGGLAGAHLNTMGALSAERSLGRVAVGARVGYISGTTFVSPGGLEAGFGEAFVSVTRRGRLADLRASVGGGVAEIDYFSGAEFFCDDPLPDLECASGELDGHSVEGWRAYGLGAVGLDLHLSSGIAIGPEIRAAFMRGQANVSSAQVGLRVRLGR